jgi:hypothetical protein
VKYKATHENGSILYLDSDADGGDNYDPSDRAFFGGKGWTSLDEDWKVEPIIELPTNCAPSSELGATRTGLAPRASGSMPRGTPGLSGL